MRTKTVLCAVVVLLLAKTSFADDLSYYYTESELTAGVTIMHGIGVKAEAAYSCASWNSMYGRAMAMGKLYSSKQRIEALLRPMGLHVQWGQLSTTESAGILTYTVSLYQIGMAMDPAYGAARLMELQRIRMLIAEAVAAAKTHFCMVGSGWIGNMTAGPFCNELYQFIYDYIVARAAERAILFQYYDIVGLFEAGWLPGDLLAHIYFGIVDRETGELIEVYDPWRTGNADPIDPADNPNGEPESITPWYPQSGGASGGGESSPSAVPSDGGSTTYPSTTGGSPSTYPSTTGQPPNTYPLMGGGGGT